MCHPHHFRAVMATSCLAANHALHCLFWDLGGKLDNYFWNIVCRTAPSLPKMRRGTRMPMLLAVWAMWVLAGRSAEGCIPPPAVVCEQEGSGCTIFNNQGVWEDRGQCRAANAAFPKTEAELVDAVARAVKNKQKINVVSALAHSHTRLVCVGERGLIISTVDYASTLAVNKTAGTITVDAGALMRDVIDEAAKEGLTLPASPSWDGVSAAGAVSTGAHGSGLAGRGSALNEYVVAMRLVVPASASEGYARVVHVTPEHDRELRAARLSLGTLGAISQVTLGLEPMFKRSVSLSLEDDADLEARLEGFMRAHEFGDVNWYPAHGKALYGRIGRAPVDATGDGLNRAAFQPTTVARVQQSAAKFDFIEATRDAGRLCNTTGRSMVARAANGGGYLNDGSRFTGYPVVGFNNRMQASGGCQDYRHRHEYDSACGGSLGPNASVCSWDRRVRGTLAFDVEIGVPLSRVRAALADLKRLRDLNRSSACGLDIEAVRMRSVRKSSAYLGIAEDAVTMEFIYYRPREPYAPAWNMDLYQEMEQLLVEKYGGTLHWAKSGGYLFQGIARRAVSLDGFLAVKKEFDPDGLFSNDWTDGLLGIGGKGVVQYGEGCALEKLCKCSEDWHCSPKNGYFCRPGRIWKNARVCRREID